MNIFCCDCEMGVVWVEGIVAKTVSVASRIGWWHVCSFGVLESGSPIAVVQQVRGCSTDFLLMRRLLLGYQDVLQLFKIWCP